MSAKDTDQELVRRVQRGDKRAFELLFARYQHKILGLVSRYVRDAEDLLLTDISHLTFARLHRRAFRARV